MMVDYLRDYKGMIQNIVWSKSQTDIELRREILSNSDMESSNGTPYCRTQG